MAAETAVVDACVLFRGGVRDFLLWVAEAGVFSPVWSNVIHDEWIKNRHAKRGDPMSRLDYARAEMEKAFPGANFDPDPQTLTTLKLPDMNDLHVVATAVAAKANSIVTYNGRHFPGPVVEPLGLRIETPDMFCARLINQARALVIEGARLHRSGLKKPPYNSEPYLDHLKSQELTRTADLLREVQHLI
jgi:predicted nucleic acid-binding protein